MERRESGFGVWPCEVCFDKRKLWLYSCCLRQPHATTTRTHTCKARVGGGKKHTFIFFHLPWRQIQQLHLQASFSLFAQYYQGHPSRVDWEQCISVPGQISLSLTHPWAPQEGARAKNKGNPTVGCCRTVECDRRDRMCHHTGTEWTQLLQDLTNYTCEEAKSPLLRLLHPFPSLSVQVWGKKEEEDCLSKCLRRWCNFFPGWGQLGFWGGSNPFCTLQMCDMLSL